jgi:sterol desaturase/sphingolipid hydroxylase (fatty acid hydroxylase superfamily)
MTLHTILVWSLPAVIGLALLEAVVFALVFRRPRNWRSYAASLTDALAREYVVYPLVALSLAGPLVGWAWQHRVATVPLGGAASLAVLFVGQEFCYYWYHRAAHRVRWFWATHAVHHSPNEFNLGIAYRFGWTGKATGTALFYVPMIWLGFAPEAVFATLSLNLLYQFWIHVDWIPRLGWLEYVLNTPSHHRVHHASNAEYIDRNYGGVLIVFDRLFGTFAEERAGEPCRYGLTTPLVSNNPVKIAFHEWLRLANDLYAARSLRDVLLHLFGPPGWRPASADGRMRALPRVSVEGSANEQSDYRDQPLHRLGA